MPNLQQSNLPEVQFTVQWVQRELEAAGQDLATQTVNVKITCQVLRLLPHLAHPLGIPLFKKGLTVWELFKQWNADPVCERLSSHSFTVRDVMCLERHGLSSMHTYPVHPPLLERFEERTGLSRLAVLSGTTHSMQLVFPFEDTAPVVQAQVSVQWKGQEFTGGSAFWEIFKRIAEVEPTSRHLKEHHVVKAEHIVVHGREQPNVDFYAGVPHDGSLVVPVYASVSETKDRITLMLVLREVTVQGKHTSEKLAAKCKTRKLLLTYNTQSRKLYRIEGGSIKDVSYRDALPEQATFGPLKALGVFEGRIRQILLDTELPDDTRWLIQHAPLEDVIALATTPPVTHYAHLRIRSHIWYGSWGFDLLLPGKWLRPGRRKTGVEFKRRVFPRMDRRVLRQVTPQNVVFVHQLALLLGNPERVLDVLALPRKAEDWLQAGVLIQVLKKGRVAKRQASFTKAFMRSIRRQGLEDTLMEVNNTSRQLQVILKHQPDFTLPEEVTCITRLHNQINRQALEHTGRRHKGPFKVLKAVQERLRQHVELEGVQVDFQVALTEAELMDVGMDMNICVGGYGSRVRKGGVVIVVGRQDGRAVFCLEVTGDQVLQFKMKHNRLPSGFHLKLAQQYLRQVNLRCTSDLHFIPPAEEPFVRLLQSKDIPKELEEYPWVV